MKQSAKQRARAWRGSTLDHRRRSKGGKRDPAGLLWLAFAVPLLAMVAIVVVGASGSDDKEQVLQAAPAFALPTTMGTSASLDAVLSSGDPALLYFSMGVGCDGCFAQIPEIESALGERGITLVSIMVDPTDVVAGEAARFGITSPILIDADRSVSRAYDMLGVYGHSDRPSHSFALIGADGQVKWTRHYATMFVPAADLLAELPAL